MPERLQTYLNGVLVDEHLGHDIPELVEVEESPTKAPQVGFSVTLGSGQTLASISEQSRDGLATTINTPELVHCVQTIFKLSHD